MLSWWPLIAQKGQQMGMDGLPCGFHEYGVHYGVAFLLWSTFTCVHGLFQRKQGTYRYEINSAAIPFWYRTERKLLSSKFLNDTLPLPHCTCTIKLHSSSSLSFSQFFFYTLRLHEYIIVSKPSSSISPPLNPPPPLQKKKQKNRGHRGVPSFVRSFVQEDSNSPETFTQQVSVLTQQFKRHQFKRHISVYVIGRKSKNFSIIDSNLKSLMCTVVTNW